MLTKHTEYSKKKGMDLNIIQNPISTDKQGDSRCPTANILLTRVKSHYIPDKIDEL